jgi:cytochrome c
MRLLSLGVCLAFLTSAAAAEDMNTLHRGEALLASNCSRCHATGSVGESRHPQAPLFRTLAKRYPIESLEEALGEGIISGHPDMPEFIFSGENVGAIVIYLKSIQEH